MPMPALCLPGTSPETVIDSTRMLPARILTTRAEVPPRNSSAQNLTLPALRPHQVTEAQQDS